MKFYLATYVQARFGAYANEKVYIEGGNAIENVCVRSTSIPVTFTPVDKTHHEEVLKLENILQGNSSSVDGASLVQKHNAEPWSIVIDLGLYASSANPDNSEANSLSRDGFLRVRDSISKGSLEELKQIYLDKEFKLTVQIENVRNTDQRILWHKLMNIIDEEVNLIPQCKYYGVEKSGLDVLAATHWGQWTQSNSDCNILYMPRYNEPSMGTWEANITVIAAITEKYAEIDTTVTDKLYMNKRLLLEQICTDATIIAGNGIGVKCHRAVLSVHSSVLATMFQTAMQESQTNTVEMPDLSEASVRAFLSYLYYWETKEVNKNSLICFELFAAAHKYDICDLEKCTEEILMIKDKNWYDIDVAMKLFIFSRKIPNGDYLLNENCSDFEIVSFTLQIMKIMENFVKLKVWNLQIFFTSFCRRFSDLESSPSYQLLFTDDPKSAMELCKYAFSC